MRIIFTIALLVFTSCNFQPKKELPKTKQYSQLIGKWKVINSSFLPFEHISYCDRLEVNSIFVFDKFGTITVYENESSKNNCNQNQSYWIENDKLNIFEYDFVFTYDVLKLTSDTLKLKTTNAPDYLYSGELLSEPADSERNMKIDYIHEKGITITLMKEKGKQ